MVCCDSLRLLVAMKKNIRILHAKMPSCVRTATDVHAHCELWLPEDSPDPKTKPKEGIHMARKDTPAQVVGLGRFELTMSVALRHNHGGSGKAKAEDNKASDANHNAAVELVTIGGSEELENR